MPVFTKLTPNLLVASVERSLAFYVDALGFARGMTGPEVVVMPIETKFYGMREFAIEDPDGYVITFAERVDG
jgi:hypothetical protein